MSWSLFLLVVLQQWINIKSSLWFILDLESINTYVCTNQLKD